MITDNDKAIIKFLTNIPCYSNTISKIFYSNLKTQRYCNSRLSYLCDYGYIKRSRKHASEFYFYWSGKGKREPADKHKIHYDLIARAFWWIQQNGYNILTVEIQKKNGKVKPDLLLRIEKCGKSNILPVEIERSNNIENTIRKYEDTDFNKILLFSKRPFNKDTCIEIVDIRLSELL